MPKKITMVTITPSVGRTPVSFLPGAQRYEWDPPANVQGQYTQNGVRGPWEKTLRATLKYVSGDIDQFIDQLKQFAADNGMSSPYLQLDEEEEFGYDGGHDPVISFHDTRVATDEEVEWIRKQLGWNDQEKLRREEEAIDQALKQIGRLSSTQKAALKAKLDE